MTIPGLTEPYQGPSAETRPNTLRRRIARLIAGSAWPTPSEQTTVAGLTEDMLTGMMKPFFELSTDRADTYRDVKEMDDTVDEVATALDMLSDNAVSVATGGNAAFSIAYTGNVPTRVKDAIEGVMERTRWHEKAYEIARGMLLYGDDFRQVVWDSNRNIVRLMYMPPKSMNRLEDEHGLLRMGNVPGQWAFEQVWPSTGTYIAGFYPWEMMHLRWNKSGASRYGRSLLYTARTSWRKLQAMEEALVINWITRAFARLLFTLDVTNKSPKEARKAINDFKHSLQTRKIARDVEGVEQLSVVKDIYLGQSYVEIGGRAYPGLTDAKVLDTSSTGYMQLGPIEYYRSKILMDLRTPKAYLGLEKDINAKATLIQQDRRYARFLRRIQSVLSSGIGFTINLQLAAYDIDPKTIPYIISWPSPSWSDRLEDSQALLNYAQADQILEPMGVLDKELIARRQLLLSGVEWDQIQKRMETNERD